MSCFWWTFLLGWRFNLMLPAVAIGGLRRKSACVLQQIIRRWRLRAGERPHQFIKDLPNHQTHSGARPSARLFVCSSARLLVCCPPSDRNVTATDCTLQKTDQRWNELWWSWRPVTGWVIEPVLAVVTFLTLVRRCLGRRCPRAHSPQLIPTMWTIRWRAVPHRLTVISTTGVAPHAPSTEASDSSFPALSKKFIFQVLSFPL